MLSLRSVFFYLLCLPTLLLGGCSSHKSSSKQNISSEASLLRFNLTRDPASFDPRLVRTIRDLALAKSLFEGLMRLDPQGLPTPALAQTVVCSEKGCCYTFTLRKASWQEGSPVTASQIAHSWRTALSPNFPCDYAHLLYPIVGAEEIRRGERDSETLGVSAPDEQTLVVHLKQPTPYFLELLAFPTFFPVHPESTATTPISNGPFQLASYHPQSELRLTKNPKYWDAATVSLSQLVFSILPDAHAEQLLFEKGELDWLGQPLSHAISTAFLTQTKDQPSHHYPVAGTCWFQFNTRRSPLHHPNVRKALSYAIDRSAIIQHILQGDQAIATGVLPPSMALRPTPYFQDHDGQRARTFLQEALEELSLSSLPPLRLLYRQDERSSLIAQLVQQQWKQTLGIEITLQACEDGVYRAHRKTGEYDIAWADWIADYNDPISFLEIFSHPQEEGGSGINETGWHNSLYDQCLLQASSTGDASGRKAYLAAAEEILIEDMPIAPVYHMSFTYFKKPWVEAVVVSPLGIPDFKYARKSPPAS